MPLASASRSCCRQLAVRASAKPPFRQHANGHESAHGCVILSTSESRYTHRLPPVPRFGLRTRGWGRGWIASDKYRRRSVVQGPGELAPPPQAEATHQSFSSASSPQRRASLPPPLRAPPLRAPPLIPRKPRQHPASRARHGASFCRKKTHSSKKTRRTRVEADTLPPTTSALATAIMRTESRAASLPAATSANSVCICQRVAASTRKCTYTIACVYVWSFFRPMQRTRFSRYNFW